MIGRAAILALGVAATVALAALWHGPVGTADRIAASVESAARAELDRLEMTAVEARLERGPLTRRLLLSGPADDFQRRELLRIMAGMPGVADVRWQQSGAAGALTLPLLLEAVLLALAGFSLGLLLSYVIELRRRARAEWRW